jgi:predicted RNase H-like nuclease (RuvC/YqgF family)
MTEKYKPRWYKEACWECGTEGYSTRTQEDVPIDTPYYCEICETINEAEAQFSKTIEEKDTEIERLKTELEDIKVELKDMRIEQRELQREFSRLEQEQDIAWMESEGLDFMC